MAFQREKQNVTASELLQALADGEDVQLSQCTVTGVLNINRFFDPAEKFQIQNLSVTESEGSKTLTLSQSIVFDNCVFEENVIFTGPWADPESVSVNFEKGVIFNSSVFKSQSRFRNAIFEGVAGFDGCSFGGVATFKNAYLQKEAKFRTAVFSGYTLFGSAVFEGSARFTNTQFVKGANFSDVRFLADTDFSGVYSSSRAVPACESIYFALGQYGDDESFWRFVKQSAQEAGYYQLAGEYFYSERCASLWNKARGHCLNETISPLKKMVRTVWSIRLLPEFVFGKLLFGYGERPIRVLVASALIIVLCAFFYSQPGSLVHRAGVDESASFLQGLYFSTITFTTLGYGDLYPAPHRICRFVAMSEAVAGGCLMALFVVCLAKRFSRG